MFVKLFSSILDSSIWQESPATKVVWITMLAMADENGMVNASKKGILYRANVPIDDGERAFEILQSPDPDSKCSDHEGRRIVKEGSQWRIINYLNYKGNHAKETEPSKRHRTSRPVAVKSETLKLGEFGNVLLANAELESLYVKLGRAETDALIKEMSSYMAAKGVSYKSYYAAICQWAARRQRGRLKPVETPADTFIKSMAEKYPWDDDIKQLNGGGE